LGIFISIVQNQKRVLAEQQLLNQISYVEEYMSKALRMARTDRDGDCLIGAGNIYELTHQDLSSVSTYRGIKFINQSDNNTCQEFFLDGAGTPESPYVLKEAKNNGGAVALTSDDLEINSMRFVINGSSIDTFAERCTGSGQCTQPRVTIVLSVAIPGDSQSPQRTIQTTVSRRNLNVYSAQ